MFDFVYQPRAKSIGNTMANNMVCHAERVRCAMDHGHGQTFSANKGDVWTCVTGQPEHVENTGSTVPIMRVINLLPG